MSAESKKKHGVAGASNAKNSPFRLNGWAPDWEAKRRGVYGATAALTAGSRFLGALVAGLIVSRMPFMGPFPAGQWERRIEHAEKRVTSPVFRIPNDPASVG